MIDTFQNMFVEDRSIISFESICIATQLKRIMTKRIRKFRNQSFVTSQVDTNINIVVDEFSSISKQMSCDISKINTIVMITNIQFVVSKFVKWNNSITSSQKSLFDINIVHEFSFILKKIQCDLFEINTIIVNSNDIKSIDEIFAFKFRKWFATITTLFEINIVYEFSFVLMKMSCELFEINIDIVNFNDIESIDEILAFEFDKWIVAVAKKKIFDYTITFHITSKNSFVFDIDKFIEAMKASNKACVENIVDVKILNQKIFALIALYDAFSKKSFASYVKNIEISIAMNTSSLEHFTKQNNFVIETFDSDIELDAYSKNQLIQHIENLKTLKKNSIYIYKLFALFVFDLIIDIDFEIYTIDIETIIQTSIASFRRKMQLSSFRDFALRNISFDWNRSNINFIDRRTFLISICIIVSSVTFIVSNVTIDFIEIAKIVEIVEKYSLRRKMTKSPVDIIWRKKN